MYTITMKKLFEKYLNLFEIDPNFVEFQTSDGGESVIVSDDKAIINYDDSLVMEDSVIVALLKLGLEYDKLLSTLHFDPSANPNIVQSFYIHTNPIRVTWTWKMMVKYLSKEELTKEILEINNYYEELKSVAKTDEEKSIVLELWLVLTIYGGGHEEFIFADNFKIPIEEYINYGKQEPNVEIFLEVFKRETGIDVKVEDGLYIFR